MLVTEYCDSVHAFKLKLSFWQTQLGDGDASHFLFLTAMHEIEYNAGLNKYKDEITELLYENERRFQVLR